MEGKEKEIFALAVTKLQETIEEITDPFYELEGEPFFSSQVGLIKAISAMLEANIGLLEYADNTKGDQCRRYIVNKISQPIAKTIIDGLLREKGKEQ